MARLSKGTFISKYGSRTLAFKSNCPSFPALQASSKPCLETSPTAKEGFPFDRGFEEALTQMEEAERKEAEAAAWFNGLGETGLLVWDLLL